VAACEFNLFLCLVLEGDMRDAVQRPTDGDGHAACEIRMYPNKYKLLTSESAEGRLARYEMDKNMRE